MEAIKRVPRTRRSTEFAAQDRDIDARSIVTLIVFFVVNALVIFPLRIPLPLFLPRLYRRYLVIDRSEFSSPALASSTSPDTVTTLQKPPVPSPTQKPEAIKPNGTVIDSPDTSLNGEVTEKQANGTPPMTKSKSSDSDDVTEKKNAASKDAPSKEDIKRWHITIGLETAPVIGVLLLLASTCIPGSVIRDGIVGSEGVRPYDIMTLFLSFAYISISLDTTGLLRYLAFVVAAKSSSSGSLLYSTFYGFWVLAGLIVGNDPLILSGTPFLAYFTSHAKIHPPTAYLFTQFQAANLVSALLVSSNPTNLVLTQAFGISFLSYSAWLALPTIAGAIALFPILRWWSFRSPDMIPRKLYPPKVDPKSALKDPYGGIFGATLFIVTIALLIGLSAAGYLEGVEGVWTVTAPAALVMVSRDLIYDLVKAKKNNAEDLIISEETIKEQVKPIGNSEDAERDSTEVHGVSNGEAEPTQEENGGQVSRIPSRASSTAPNSRVPSRVPSPQLKATEHLSLPGTPTNQTPVHSAAPSRSPTPSPPGTPQTPDGTSTPPEPSTPTGRYEPSSKLLIPIAPFIRTFPTFSSIFTRLPIPLIPFAFSMFILVESLQYTGWIKVWAGWWKAWAEVGGVAGSVWLMGVIGVLGCNLFGTNIGATVLLSRVLQVWHLSNENVSNRTLYGAVFALAVASNFGAYSFVFSASLAGLLWRGILSQKNMVVKQIDFIRWNTVPMVITMIVGCLVVAGEVCVMYKT